MYVYIHASEDLVIQALLAIKRGGSCDGLESRGVQSISRRKEENQRKSKGAYWNLQPMMRIEPSKEPVAKTISLGWKARELDRGMKADG